MLDKIVFQNVSQFAILFQKCHYIVDNDNQA